MIWHGVRLGKPDWSYESRSVALELQAQPAGEHLYIILNAYWEPLHFELPPLTGEEHWYRIIDTAFPAPQDIQSLAAAPVVESTTYTAEGRSTALLMVRRSCTELQ